MSDQDNDAATTNEEHSRPRQLHAHHREHHSHHERRAHGRDRGAGLSQELIVRAAIDLIDEIGLEGLSMRRVATALGVGVMSLYWYVARKENLLGLVAEEIFRELDLPSRPSGDWKADLRLVGERTWEVFARHPWIVRSMDQPHDIVGDAFMRHIEFSYGSLSELGVEPRLMTYIVSAVDMYVFGTAMLFGREQALDRAGHEQREQATNQFQQLLGTGRYPYAQRLHEQMPEFADDNGDPFGDHDRMFAFGLDALLDGLERSLIEAGYLDHWAVSGTQADMSERKRSPEDADDAATARNGATGRAGTADGPTD